MESNTVFIILLSVLTFLVLIVSTFQIILLVVIFRILKKFQSTLDYVEHIRAMLQVLENWPIQIGKRIVEWFLKK
jgi:hypothetical protein